MNRKLLTVLAGVALASVPTAAFAGESEATALHVEGVITVSDSEAEEGSASNDGLTVLGTQVTGTSQEGPGSSEDGIGGEDPSGNEGGEVWLFHSQSEVDGNGDSRSSGEAAYVNLGGEAEVAVLRSEANSNGDAESDGVYVNLGGTEFHILHAESSGGVGTAAVAVLDGNEVLGSGEDDGIICPLDANPVGETEVVCASGSTAGILRETSVLDGTVTGGVLTVGADDDGDEVLTPAAPGGPVASPNPGSGPDFPLARTGSDLLALLFGGLLTIGAGEAARRRGAFVTFA